MNRISRLALQVLAVDLGTVLVFATLHQVFIAWTVGPYFGALFGIVPAVPVVWAWLSWGPGRPSPWTLGVAAALCGVLPWLAVLAALWGTSDDPSGATRAFAATLGATMLAGGLAFAATRRWQPALASATALFLTFFFASDFILTAPVAWVNLRAVLSLGVGIVGGTLALGWMTERLEQRPVAVVQAVPA